MNFWLVVIGSFTLVVCLHKLYGTEKAILMTMTLGTAIQSIGDIPRTIKAFRAADSTRAYIESALCDPVVTITAKVTLYILGFVFGVLTGVHIVTHHNWKDVRCIVAWSVCVCFVMEYSACLHINTDPANMDSLLGWPLPLFLLYCAIWAATTVMHIKDGYCPLLVLSIQIQMLCTIALACLPFSNAAWKLL